MIECLLNIVENVIVVDELVVPWYPAWPAVVVQNMRARLYATAKWFLKMSQVLVLGCKASRRHNCLAVEASNLECHDGHVHHSCHTSQWGHHNEGGDVAVFKAVEICFNGLHWIPWRSKGSVAGQFFCRQWAPVHSTEVV